MFRTDNGDDEGFAEWSYGRVPGTVHRRGQHDVEIELAAFGESEKQAPNDATGS
jgi:hypothetical protein